MNPGAGVVHLPLPPGEQASSVADTKLARAELGFTADHSLKDKLAEVIKA